MRLVGLSEKGYVATILIQAVMFVIPSIICSFLCMFPAFYMLYKFAFTTDMGFEPSYWP